MKKLIAVVVAMMLALAFTACAQEMKKDEMPKDDMMKAEETEKDSMEKDAMAEEAMEKKDEMMGEACMCAKKDMMEEKAEEGSEMKEAVAAIGPSCGAPETGSSCGAPDIDVALSFGCCG